MNAVARNTRRLAFVGIGSNLDEPHRQIDAAINRLAALPGCDVFAVSSLYRSAPFGPVEQPDFLNAVVALTTDMSARALFAALQSIEEDMGRQRSERWGARIIDLDLLVFGDAVVNDDDLVVPHPGIGERNFVLLPLAEIAPELDIPGLGPVRDIKVSTTEPRIERVQDRKALLDPYSR